MRASEDRLLIPYYVAEKEYKKYRYVEYGTMKPVSEKLYYVTETKYLSIPMHKGTIITHEEKGNLMGLLSQEGKEYCPFQYREIRKEGDALYWFLKIKEENGQWVKYRGYMDHEGREIVCIPCEDLRDFNGKLIILKKDGKWGLADTSGNLVLPAEYDDIQLTGTKQHYILTRDGKKAMADTEGRLLTDFIADKFSEITSLYLYSVGEKYGVCDKAGKLLLPAIFDEIKNYTTLLACFSSGKLSLYNLTGQLLHEPGTFEDIYPAEGYFLVYKNHKSGLLSEDGQLLLKTEYDDIKRCGDRVILEKSVDEETEYSLATTTGTILIPAGVYAVIDPSETGYFPVKSKDGNTGVINAEGKIVVALLYREPRDSGSSLFEGESELFINAAGFHIISRDGAIRFTTTETLLTIGRDLYWNKSARPYVMNSYGQKLFDLPANTESVRLLTINGPADTYCLAVKNKEQLLSVISATGEQLLKPAYDTITISEGRIIAGLKRKKAVFAADGQELVPLKYTDVRALESGYFAVSGNKGWGVFNSHTHEELIAPVHESIYQFSNTNSGSFFGGRNDKMVTLFNNSGKQAVPYSSDYKLTDTGMLWNEKHLFFTDCEGRQYADSGYLNGKVELSPPVQEAVTLTIEFTDILTLAEARKTLPGDCLMITGFADEQNGFVPLFLDLYEDPQEFSNSIPGVFGFTANTLSKKKGFSKPILRYEKLRQLLNGVDIIPRNYMPGDEDPEGLFSFTDSPVFVKQQYGLFIDGLDAKDTIFLPFQQEYIKQLRMKGYVKGLGVNGLISVYKTRKENGAVQDAAMDELTAAFTEYYSAEEKIRFTGCRIPGYHEMMKWYISNFLPGYIVQIKDESSRFSPLTLLDPDGNTCTEKEADKRHKEAILMLMRIVRFSVEKGLIVTEKGLKPPASEKELGKWRSVLQLADGLPEKTRKIF